MTRCVGYCRVSTLRQRREGRSLEAQAKHIERYCKEQGLDLVRIYKESRSASFEERTEFNKMLEEMRRDGISVLVCEKIDRFHRNMGGEDIIRDNRLTCHFIDNGMVFNWKSSKAVEKFIFRILSSASAYESDMIGERIRVSVDEKLLKGEYPSLAPLGYKNIPKSVGKKKRIVKTADAPKVARLFELYASGAYSVIDLERICDEMGLKSKRGKPLRKTSIIKILKNPFYCGEWQWGEYKGTNITKDGKEYYEPLISKELFDRCQEVFIEHDKIPKAKRKNRGREWKFKGLIICGLCGRTLLCEDMRYSYISKKTGKEKTLGTLWYHCSHGDYFVLRKNGQKVRKDLVDKKRNVIKENVIDESGKIVLRKGEPVKRVKCDMPWFKEEEIEEIFLDYIATIEFNKKVWNEIKESLLDKKRRQEIETEIHLLEKESSSNEDALDRLYRDFTDGLIDKEFFRKRFEKLRRKQNDLKKKLENMIRMRKTFGDDLIKKIDILDSLGSFGEKFRSADDKTKKTMIRMMTDSIFAVKSGTGKFIDEKPTTIGNVKAYMGKDLQIVWNEQVRELYERGLIKMSKKWEEKHGKSIKLSIIQNSY